MPPPEDRSRPAAVYTMGQLNQKTSIVMDQIEKHGLALITRNGHFVALIQSIKQDVIARVMADKAVAAAKQESSPSAQASADKPVIYNTRQLGQQTAQVIDEIEKNGPALITRHGHYVAVIIPITGEIEARVLADYARGLQAFAQEPA